MTSMLTARVDAEKRAKAEKVFDEVGLTTSAAVNIFICAVAATGGIPFPVGKPGGTSVASMRPVVGRDDALGVRHAAGFRQLIGSLPKSGRTEPYRFNRADATDRELRCGK